MPQVSPSTQSTADPLGREVWRRYLRVGAWVGAIAIFLTMLVVGYRTVSDIVACTPVPQTELAVQQAIIVERVADAYDIDAMVADCDDNGDGFISFKTHLTPGAARSAFLTDSSCQPYSDDGEVDIAVLCSSGRFPVYVFFEVPPTGGVTTGDLRIET